MTIGRHLVDRLDFSLFMREAIYGQGVRVDSASSCQMTDYDDASPHITWDDMVQTNTDVLTGREFPTHQEIARQSVTFTYTEPRTKPNTIAGLLGLAMGGIPVASKDPNANAWRHRLTMGGATSLPSMSIRALYDRPQYDAATGTGTIFRYDGMKVSTITLSNNGAYWQLAATLMGSGIRRVLRVPTDPLYLPSVVEEPWLRWGETKIYLRPLRAGTLTVPLTPAQRSANLVGGTPVQSTIDLSCYVRSISLTLNNNFATDAGYRACSGLFRENLHSTRREITGELTFDVDDAFERQAIQTYLQQYNMGLEIDCAAATTILATSSMRYGFSLLLPAARLTQITRGQQDQLENLTYAFTALDDRVNQPLYAWAYNRRQRYLGATA
jgi:hypothetical protein